VVDHRVHVARADPEEEPRAAEPPPIIDLLPIRLADDAHAESGGFEHAAQDCHREAGMVDVGVARDEDDVELVPAAAAGFGHGHGEWLGCVTRSARNARDGVPYSAQRLQ
jgi:hypothetical protein